MKKFTIIALIIFLTATIVKGKTLPEKIVRLLDRNAVIEKTESGENIVVYHHNGKGKYKTTFFPKIETTLLHSFEKPN